MRPLPRKALKATVWGLAAVAVVACAVLFRLIYIGEPGKSASLEFQGFVLLPKSGMLTVLDYVTIRDQRLFVTDESTGSVYKIILHENALPQSSDVSVFSGEPAAHGVALDPATQLAYVTRSEVNAVDVFDPAAMKSVARIPVDEDADAIMFDSLHNLIYVANGDAHLATLIDSKTRKVVTTIPLGGKPEFMALDTETKLIYENLRDINAVAAVDVAIKRDMEILMSEAAKAKIPILIRMIRHGRQHDDRYRRGCPQASAQAKTIRRTFHRLRLRPIPNDQALVSAAPPTRLDGRARHACRTTVRPPSRRGPGPGSNIYEHRQY